MRRARSGNHPHPNPLPSRERGPEHPVRKSHLTPPLTPSPLGGESWGEEYPGSARSLRWLIPFLAAFLLTACNGDDAPAEEVVDPVALLDSAATRLESVESFHFVIEFEDGAAEIVRGLSMERAEGNVVVPDEIDARVNASLGPINAEIGIIVADGQGYLTNPLTGRWEEEDISVADVFDLQTGVTSIMRSAQDPEITGNEDIDSVSTYRVEATLPSSELSLIPGVRQNQTLDATAWIGVDDPLVYRVQLVGAMFDENESTVTLDLSDFDQPVEIEPPQ